MDQHDMPKNRESTITTWADGHGIWHATVSCDEYTNEREERKARRQARAAIKVEVASRQGDQDPVIRVRYVGMVRKASGSFALHYKES